MYDQDLNTNYITKVADLAADDKPREKAMTGGIKSLSKVELMAIILGSGMVGKSVIELSREILRDNNNNLYQVSLKSIDELSNYPGIGPAKAISLQAAFELGTRCVEDGQQPAEQIKSGEDVYRMMRQKLANLNHEEFWILHLSRANKVIARECVSRGGTAATVVDVKMILKSALNKLDSGLILVHNHPSGNLHPSPQDDDITRRIKAGATTLDIRVLDHVIVTAGGYYSYSQEGKL